MTFTIQKAASVLNQNRSPLWLNLAQASAFAQHNVALMGYWVDSTIRSDHTDSDKNLTSLPTGVTSVSLYIVIGPTDSTPTTNTGLKADFDGNYTIKWDGGPTTVTINNGTNLTSVADRHMTVDLTLGNRFITFSGLTEANLPSNIRVVRTSELADFEGGEFWRQAWIDKFLRADTGHVGEPLFDCLRMMDLYRTNWSPEVLWADRMSTTSQSMRNRYPIEHLVDLCNRVGSDMYFCMPHRADDTYMTNAATLIKNSLNGRCYYAYTNEVWNSQFQDGGAGSGSNGQYTWVNEQGGIDFSTTEGIVPGANYYGKRVAEMAEIIDGVYGSDRESHLIVLEWQSANTLYSNDVLVAPLWQAADPSNYKAPHSVIDAISIAPYFGHQTSRRRAIWETYAASGEAAALTVIWDETEADIPDTGGDIAKWKAIAEQYGVELISYENGQHLEQQNSGNANLFKTEIEVTDGSQYTVGEEVNNGLSGANYAYGDIAEINGNWIIVDTVAQQDSAEFDAGSSPYELVSEDGLEIQTVQSGIIDYNLKDGVLELFEDAVFSSEMGALIGDHIALFHEKGGKGYNFFSSSTIPSKYGMWGMWRHLSDTNGLDTALRNYVANNPRAWTLPKHRREVSW